MSGSWIKLYRQLLNNDIWTAEPFTQGQAWIDLLLRIDRTDGTLTDTISALSKRWQWTWHKTKRYLDRLEKDKMIAVSNSASNDRPIARPIQIHIIKWKDFQGENAPRPIARPKGDQRSGQRNENLPFNIITRNIQEGQETRACAKAPAKETAADFFLRISAEEEDDDKK